MRTKILNRPILGIYLNTTSYFDAVKQVFEWVDIPIGRYVCLSNVHMCMEAFDDSGFRSIVNNADMVVPDGRPLVWSLRLSGKKKAAQVRGSDLFLRICEEAERENVSVGFYGATQHSLNDLVKEIKNRFPNLVITFSVSPPFRALTVEEESNYIKGINASGTKILFVGIGCPKQEKWMAAHKDKLSCVMIGVGAAFDFFSGHKKQAPLWLQRVGLEWLFRLASDPRRLWKRYLKHNPRFVYYFLLQLMREKIHKNLSDSEEEKEGSS